MLKSDPDAQSQLRSVGVSAGGMAADAAAQTAEAPPDMAAAAEAGAEGAEAVPTEVPVQ